MRIDHIALYVKDLEGTKDFFTKYFGGISGEMYHNPKTGLKTYFISFEDGTRLELMTRKEVMQQAFSPYRSGLTHLAFSLGSKAAVDALTSRLASDGYEILSGPRTTGDGYYESCIKAPENNIIELTE